MLTPSEHAHVEGPCRHTASQGLAGEASRTPIWVATPRSELSGGAVPDHIVADLHRRTQNFVAVASGIGSVAVSDQPLPPSPSVLTHLPMWPPTWYFLAIAAQRVRGQGSWEEEGSLSSARQPRCAEKLEGVWEPTRSSVIWMLGSSMGLPLWHGAQLAMDTTLVSPLHGDGTTKRGAANSSGVALHAARRIKEATYPELSGEGGGRTLDRSFSETRRRHGLKRRHSSFKERSRPLTFVGGVPSWLAVWRELLQSLCWRGLCQAPERTSLRWMLL